MRYVHIPGDSNITTLFKIDKMLAKKNTTEFNLQTDWFYYNTRDTLVCVFYVPVSIFSIKCHLCRFSGLAKLLIYDYHLQNYNGN